MKLIIVIIIIMDFILIEKIEKTVPFQENLIEKMIFNFLHHPH